jgi:hypothetical protein
MKLSVLPLPVCEWMASEAKTRLIAACWMGSGRRAPIIRTRASSEESNGMPPKVVVLVAVVRRIDWRSRRLFNKHTLVNGETVNRNTGLN